MGRQRRRRRHHPQGRQHAGLRRDRGPGGHLADLVGAGQGWPRQDLPRRSSRARRGPALHRLLQPQKRALHLSGPRARGGPRAELLRPHPLPEVLQNHRRGRLGGLLSLHLHDLSQGNHPADLHAGAVGRGKARPRTGQHGAVPARQQPRGPAPGTGEAEQTSDGPAGQNGHGPATRGRKGDHRDRCEPGPACVAGRPRHPSRADPAHVLGWREPAERVGPAGRLLRHGPRREQV